MAQMSQVQEIFHEAAQQEALAQPQPWWKIQLFVWEPVLFGTWDGVFTSCMINIFGVVLFLRTGWLVGNTGVLMGVFLVSFVALVALVTVLSGIGVGEHCGVGRGGVYSMVASVLGGQTGGAIGLLYVFGQCVAGAMYITGFAESVSDLLSLRNIWAVRGISVAVLLALLGINLAGVKWIIRLQLLLLLLLAVSTLDFVVGSFTHLDPEHGFIGYSPELLQNNTLPDYSPGESFFTVFGVFFPTATGVMAGFNMGGDLREPAASIPLGSLVAVGISWFLYIVFVFLLGAICTREALRYDFLIAEKVSLVGFLFLLGLYISSLASCMGGLYGAPRILQCIAQEKVIPALACLGQGNGPNKTPVAAICLTGLVTTAFVLVGQVNVLAPIVTINFMLTYIMVDYSFFSLAMGGCSLSERPESVPGEGLGALQGSEPLLLEKAPSYGSEGIAQSPSEGTLLEFTKDMDQLLQLTRTLESSQPRGGESHGILENQKGKTKKASKQTLQESFLLDLRSPASFSPGDADGWPAASWEGQRPHRNAQSPRSEGDQPRGAYGAKLIPEPSNQPRPSREDFFLKSRLQEQDIQRRPTSFYTHICNPWVSLLGAVGSLLIMFVIQWVYTLVNIGVAAIVYFYIGRTSPGLHLGLASNFSLLRWMRSLLIPSYRYLGITRPLTYPVRQNGKCMAKMILSVWLLSASITLPPLFGWAQNVNDGKVCLISQDFGYTIYSTAVAFYIPMSVMLFMYYQIYKAARKSATKHKFPGFPRPEEPDSVISLNGMVKLQKEVEECANLSRLLKHERKNISIFKREQKAATTLGIIVGAFTVCWLPFFLLSTARPFICGIACSCIPLWVERTCLWLGYANSLINPFIYAFFNRDLRTTYRSLLQCQYRNINRKLSAAGMHEALKLAERPERPELVPQNSDYCRKKSHDS